MTATTTAPADPFAAPDEPTAGEFFNWKTGLGRLLLFTVKGYSDHKPTRKTKEGEMAPVVFTDMVVLDGEDAGKEYPDCEVRGVLIRSQLKDKIGQMVLARLAEGEDRGKGAPYIFTAPTEDDRARGRNYLAQLEAKKAKNTDPFAI